MRKLTDKHLAWADYAFISGMIVQRESARRIIDLMRGSSTISC